MKELIPDRLVPLVQRLRWIGYLLIYSVVCRVKPVKPNRVVFVSRHGDHLGENLRWIRQALPETDYSIMEFFPASDQSRGKRIIDRVRLVVAVAQAQYILLDDFSHLLHAIKLRLGVRLVQVWHGMGAMKKMGFSRVGQGFGAPARTSLTHRNYTDVIVSSEAMRPHFAEGFGIPLEKIHATGVPRSDFFFDGDAQDLARDRLFAQFPQLRDHRIILFAPTYRTGVNNRVGYPLEFLDLDRIGQTLGEGDLFIIKNHPLVAESWEIPPQYADKILDLSSFEEFNHLLLVSDLLITDYSSAIFDNALLKNPVVFYTPDFEVYDGARGFYYPFDQYVYGPVVHDLDSLVALIPGVDIDEPRWSEFCELFLNSCDGRATQRFIETVFSPSVSQREGEGS